MHIPTTKSGSRQSGLRYSQRCADDGGCDDGGGEWATQVQRCSDDSQGAR